MSTIGRPLAPPVAGTSNTKPWSFAPMRLERRTVSSQVSHDPQPVGPPAQFTAVPESSATVSGARPGAYETAVTPPAKPGKPSGAPSVSGGSSNSSYAAVAVPAMRGPTDNSWLRSSVTPPPGARKAAMPSCLGGVAPPPVIASPVHENDR